MATAAVPDNDKKGEKQHSTREHVCAICLEQYRKPRGLSCLHTFCEGCIQSCILKEVEKGIQLSAIKCPVCRKDTQPVDPKKSPVEWVKDLTSNLAINYQEQKSGDDDKTIQKLCDVCDENPQAARHLCKQCNQYMCRTCTQTHNRLSTWSKHIVVTIEQAEQVVTIDLGNIEFCTIHPGKRIKFYCEGHKSMCCSTCAILKHRQCKTVVEVKELGQSFKNGDKVLSLQSKMTDLQTKLQETKSTIETNRQDVETQADTMVTRIVDMRNQIVETLDQVVTKVTENCRQIKKEDGITVDDEISSIESLFAAIASSCSLLQSVLKHGTETQIFIAFHKVEEQVKGYEELVNKDWSGLTAFDLGLELFTKFADIVGFLKSVTDVPVRKTAQKTRTVEMVNRIPDKLPLITVHKHPDMSRQPGYRGILQLEDGRAVATDRTHCTCCLMDGSCKVIAYIKLPGWPTNLAVIGPSEVVITLFTTKQLQRVTVGSNSLALNGTIPCQGREPMCVSRVSDTEVAVGWKGGLSIITLDGTEQMYVSKDSEGRKINFSDVARFTVDVKRSCCTQTCTSTNTVYCFDLTGKVKFQYKGSLTHPRGIALDRDGNVYIANYDSKNRTVHQVSPDGQFLRVISVDFRAYCLCFNTEGDEMIVTDFDDKFIQRIRFVMKDD